MGELLGRKNRRLAYGGAILGLLVAFAGGGGNDGKTSVSKAGKGFIKELELGPGRYNNAKAIVNMQDVASTYSWKPKQKLIPDKIPLIGGLSVKSPVHATLTETMKSCDMEALLWININAIKKAKREANGRYNFILHTSANPAKSDMGMTIYEKNPLNCKWSKLDPNWVNRVSTATMGTFDNQLNLLGFNFGDKSHIQTRLMAVNQIEAARYISEKCGDQIVDRFSDKKIAGGNMEERMIKDIFAVTHVGTGYKMPSPTDIDFTIVSDGTGLPNEWTSQEKQMEHAVKGLSFPNKAHMDKCIDLATGITITN